MATRISKVINGEWSQNVYDSPVKALTGLRKVVSKWEHGAEVSKREKAEERSEESKHIEGMINRYQGGDDKAYDQLTEYIGKQEERDRERIINHANRYVKTVGLPNRKWWTTVMGMDPELKADEFFKRYHGSDEETQAEMVLIANKLDGFVTERFLERKKEKGY
jgi:hypothetical protein